MGIREHGKVGQREIEAFIGESQGLKWGVGSGEVGSLGVMGMP